MMAKKKNPPGKETSDEVASAAGRLQALKGRFWIQRPFSTPGKMWSEARQAEGPRPEGTEEVSALQVFQERIATAIEAGGEAGVPRGARCRILFQSYLALAMAEKGDQLTVGEVTKLCAHETEVAVRIGTVR